MTITIVVIITIVIIVCIINNIIVVYHHQATDAGPGVGVSNLEVRFRDIEIARIHSSDRVNRIHRAPGDSGQNEAERSNAAIGDSPGGWECTQMELLWTS